MTKYILLFLLIPSLCFAQPTLEKPDIPSNKLLTENEKVEVKSYLKGKIFVELIPAKNDYVDEKDRGTVLFDPRKGINILGNEVFYASNYSSHKVIIPDDTIIHNVNFAQKIPHTEAITGKNLTFKDCNLKNVEIDPTWTIKGGLHIHARHRIIKKDGRTYEIYEVEKEGVFVEVQRIDITPIP